MQKNIILIFLVLIFICSCSETNKPVSYWLEKEKALWDGKQYTDPKKAIEYLNNAIKQEPNNAETFTKRGAAYINLGQYQQAIDDFNKAISLKQNYASAYNNRGAAYYSLGQNQQAIDDFNKAIGLNKDYANAYSNRGTAYLSQGNKKLGCSDAQKACALGNCKSLELAKGKGLCR